MSPASRATYRQALDGALADEMRRDPRVIHLAATAPPALVAEFGRDRVRRTPISEAAVTGVALGAAMSGRRPVVDWYCATFSFVAFDQIVNQVAKARYMTGGQVSVPIVFRANYFSGSRLAAQHTATTYALYAHIPGLKLVAPAGPADAYGLMRTAIRDDGPVIIFEADALAATLGEIPPDHAVPLGRAAVLRSGSAATVVAIGATVPIARAAAEILERRGIDVELIDPRSLVPLDAATIRASVRRTGRLVVVDESPPTCSFAGEIATTVLEDPVTFASLAAPVRRICSAPSPVPFSPLLEDHARPSRDDIVAAVETALEPARHGPGGRNGGTRDG